MEALIQELEGLHDQLGAILFDYEFSKQKEMTETPKKVKKVRAKKAKKEEEDDKSVKEGKAVIRFIAPDGKKIKLHFDNTDPNVEIVTDEIKPVE
jgi:hypothetical protein